MSFIVNFCTLINFWFYYFPHRKMQLRLRGMTSVKCKSIKWVIPIGGTSIKAITNSTRRTEKGNLMSTPLKSGIKYCQKTFFGDEALA